MSNLALLNAIEVEYEYRARKNKEHKAACKLNIQQLREIATEGSIYERVLCEKSFADFIDRAFKVIDSKPYVREWFVDFLCKALEETFEGYKNDKKINDALYNRLNINVIPGALKSTIFSVAANAWLWAKDPSIGVLTCTYVDDNAKRDAIKSRDLIQSDWYQHHWGHLYKITKNTEKYFKNNKHGYRHAFSLNSRGITGKRGDYLILDDLLSASDAFSKARKDNVISTINSTVLSRLNDSKKSVIIHCGQRICQGDPSDEFLKKGWNSIILPMEFDPARKCITHFGEDIRKKTGEILTIRDDEKSLAEKKTALGSFGVASQLQQLPIPAGGGILKEEWFKRYTVLPDDVKFYWSWDFAIKTGDNNDYTAGVCIAESKNRYYVCDLSLKKVQINEALLEVKDCYNSSPKTPLAIAVEDKANGSPIIHELKRTGNNGKPLPVISLVPGQKDATKKYVIIPLSKVERMMAVSPLVESGVIFIPESAWWVKVFLEQLCMFPNGIHDDICDAFCQIILYLHHKRPSGGIRFLAPI